MHEYLLSGFGVSFFLLLSSSNKMQLLIRVFRIKSSTPHDLATTIDEIHQRTINKVALATVKCVLNLGKMGMFIEFIIIRYDK